MSVSGLGEMELTFSIAALTVLCSVLAARKMLITRRGFSYCWEVLAQHQQCLSNILPLLPEQWAGGEHNLGRGHSWDHWPQSTKEIFHTIWSLLKLKSKVEGGVSGEHS